MMSRKFDLLIFGATGYTGQYIVQRLAEKIDKHRLPVKWAVASRNMANLKQCMNRISSECGKSLDHIPILEANIKDVRSMDNIFKQSKLVINCTGPYSLLGEPVVQSCVNTNTHYMDLAGEPLFMELMEMKYNEEAVKRNISIVNSCGFDSIPSDVGAEYLKEQFDGEVNQIEHYLQTWNKTKAFSYATWISLIEGFKSKDQLPAVRKKIFANKKRYNWPVKIDRKKFQNTQFGYCVPFAGADRSVVQRTQAYRYTKMGELPAQFEAYVSVPLTLLLKLSLTGFSLKFLTKYEWGEKIMHDYSKYISFGIFDKNVKPIRSELEQNRLRLTLIGKGWPDGRFPKNDQNMTKCSALIIDGGDGGYIDTAKIVVETALLFLDNIEKQKITPGVITPGVAFEASQLVPMLHEQGVTFKFVPDYKD